MTFSNALKNHSQTGWITVREVIPPVSTDAQTLIRSIPEDLQGPVAVPDNPGGEPGMCALAACVHLIREDFEPILVMNCRDSNRLLMQSRVLGALSLGVHAIIVRPEKHISHGSMPDARSVYDLDPIQFVGILDNIRRNHCLSNDLQCSGPLDMIIGIEVHAGKYDSIISTALFQKKIIAGADFAVTQPVTDFNRLAEWEQSIRKMCNFQRLPVLVRLPAGNESVPEWLLTSPVFKGIFVGSKC